MFVAVVARELEREYDALIVFCACEADIANELVTALEEETAKELDIAKELVTALEELIAKEALVAKELVIAKEELIEFVAQDEVPNKLPVIPCVTFKEPVIPNEPVICALPVKGKGEIYPSK